jgi:hypothetical protein
MIGGGHGRGADAWSPWHAEVLAHFDHCCLKSANVGVKLLLE